MEPSISEEPETFYEHQGFNFMTQLMPEEYVKQRRANLLELRDGDVIVNSFPKSGTTWVLHALCNMYDDWAKLELSDRKIVPLLTYYYRDPNVPGIMGEAIRKCVATANELPSPRVFKAHLPPFLLPSNWQEKKCKVIYISRNPKDVCVSLYHFIKGIILKGPQANEMTWSQFVEMFIDGKTFNGPWIRHVLEWYKYGPNDNVLHIKYESLKMDLKAEIKRIVDFLGRPISSEKMDEVIAGCSIEEMRKFSFKELDFDEQTYDSTVSPFFRKGKTGNWKDYFTVAQNDLFDATIGKSLNDAGLDFSYEI